MHRLAFFIACAVISSVAFAQQNPDLKVGANMYNLGFGSASQTCFDGSHDTKNGCVSKWIASNIYLSNSANSPVCVATSSTVCIGGEAPVSVPSLQDMYWIRDAVGVTQYEKAILHFTRDTGFMNATGLLGMDQFDWFEQTYGLTQGLSYYVPREAANGVLLYHGSTLVSDLTQWAYGGAVRTVTYGGVHRHRNRRGKLQQHHSGQDDYSDRIHFSHVLKREEGNRDGERRHYKRAHHYLLADMLLELHWDKRNGIFGERSNYSFWRYPVHRLYGAV